MSEMKQSNIFSKDPDDWMQYVYKFVTVKTTGVAEHVGWVYTIDPVSESICLVRFDGDLPIMDIVMGHVVDSITIINDNIELNRSKLDQMFKSQFAVPLSREELEENCSKVKDWLLKNRLPVSVSSHDSDVLNVADVLFIEPPYGPENCRSTNEIILGKIQGLLKNMPKDASEWV